jgi:hypothetical protein
MWNLLFRTQTTFLTPFSDGSVVEVVGDYAHTQSTMTYIPTRLAIRRKLRWSSSKQTIKIILAISSKRIT